jgi:putative hydrolase of the HAD superfamily
MSATRAAGIRGLLVDWGGVMTTDVFDSFAAFCEQEGISPDAVAKRFASDAESRELLVALETGAISEEQFEPRFAELLGVDSDGLIDRLFATSADDPLMRQAVARARAAGVRTGLISNSWGTRQYDRELLARLFDGVVISGEVGIRKPSVRIYELGAQAIGLAPGECVFVDDLGMNLRPAAEIGMATVHHADAQQTISELEALLAVTLR